MTPPVDLRILAVSPDDHERRAHLVADLEALAEGGLTAFMFREKSLADEDFAALGRDLRQACDALGLTFILNERSSLVEPIGARVVHLTWRSQDPVDVRAACGAEVVLGRSVHGADDARRWAGLDYLVQGPIFATPSKEGLVPTQGLASIGAVRSASGLPVVAVGGIDASRVALVKEAGAVGVAAIRAFFGAAPRAAAHAFRSEWDRGE